VTKKRFEFDEAERSALAYLVGRELASNRYPNAPHLEPLKSALISPQPTSCRHRRCVHRRQCGVRNDANGEPALGAARQTDC